MVADQDTKGTDTNENQRSPKENRQRQREAESDYKRQDENEYSKECKVCREANTAKSQKLISPDRDVQNRSLKK